MAMFQALKSSRMGSGVLLLWAGLVCISPVRADAPLCRYQIDNGVVLDVETGLSWQQSVDGGLYDWSGANAYCLGLQLNGGGWRLPTVYELQTIVDEAVVAPAIDLAAFPATPTAAFWSGTSDANSSDSAWRVHFTSGHVQVTMSNDTLRVRCVR